MGNWLVVAAAVALVTGCNYGARQFACTDDSQCQGGTVTDGKCEATGQCSFADNSCGDGGRRYGDVTGGRGTCVGAMPTTDAAIDAPPDVPPDARVCFGTTFPICLAAPPTTELTVAANTKFNTSLPTTCVATTSGGDGLCVVAATTITINAELRGVGNKPLVLIASESITINGPNGEIDVGNHRGDVDLGAGANLPANCMAGTAPLLGDNDGAGGGAGGSFVGTGATGGAGGGAGPTGAGGIAAMGTTNITTIRGGCAGQQGGDTGGGLGGRGGGAVHLIAGTGITIGGRGINAGGEGGGGGVNLESGGGGGGSGGMIGLDAPTITGNALLVASGGGGGEGSDATMAGNPGSDATDAEAANGGGGLTIGGNGGAGSARTTDPGSGNPGTAGGGNDGGGGGGGGGRGLIKAPASANLGNNVAPAPTL